MGLITTARQAEAILQEDLAELIFFGREMLRNPYFPLPASLELGADIAWPLQYLRSRPVVS